MVTCVPSSYTFMQMDKGRIAGIGITVEKASDENGYVELTPEAEQNSWAMIGM